MGYSCFGISSGSTKEIALNRGEAGGASGAAETAVECKGRQNGVHEKVNYFLRLTNLKLR